MKLLFAFIFMLISTEHTTAQTNGYYAEINGLNMYYEVYGDGIPLVLIHGGGSTIETTFGRIIKKLAETHKVIAVEMQAHGRTADIDRPLSFEQDADDIAELLRHLGFDNADIFGFSNGASTALQFAIRHPQLTHKIIVASTMYKKKGSYPWFWEMMAKPRFEDMPQAYKDAYMEINPDEKGLLRMYERDVARMQSFKDIPEKSIEGIKAPALIIAGDKDVVSPEHIVEMHRKIQNSRIAIFPGGHGDYIGELTTLKPGTTSYPALEVIEQFLNGD